LLVICKANSTASPSWRGEEAIWWGFQRKTPSHQVVALRLSVPGRNYNYEMAWDGLGWAGLGWVACSHVDRRAGQKESAWSWRRLVEGGLEGSIITASREST